ncbi:MAG TPA: glycosyltransferase [Candidatus Limnocylindrales bacterium]|nr:glycosyltransferase [Candidatus Limnocylindrales bacterium]
MSTAGPKPRIAVVSPFIDKRHGTERRVAEWIASLANDFEIHVYSQRVEDLDLGRVTWHRIPRMPGPHLLNYIWWFTANHLWRTWDKRFRGIRHDLVFSPGVNCLDADIVSVHVVFAEYRRRLGEELRLGANPVWRWPRILHRKLYYALVSFLESRVYRNPRTMLILIARRTQHELERCNSGNRDFPVVYVGLDREIFNPENRLSLRDQARSDMGYASTRFVFLLVGNDWANKGLPSLLQALTLLRELPIDLLVVGRQDPKPYLSTLAKMNLLGRVQFQLPRADVEFFYAAADAYAGPSLEDTFAQPPAEAMACGLPAIVSSTNGTSEIITSGVNGLVLADATDACSLAAIMRRLYEDVDFRERLGHSAAKSTRQYTWERNGQEIATILRDVLAGTTSLSGKSSDQRMAIPKGSLS